MGGEEKKLRSSCDSKPDGWVAWHPERGARLNIAGTEATVKACLESYFASQYLPQNEQANFVFQNGEVVERARRLMWADGWRIRPVKLVFLDDD